MRYCGIAPVHEASHIEVWKEADPDAGGSPKAWFGAVQHCDSPWSCPVCAPRVASERGELLEEVVRCWPAGMNAIALATFTIRHDKGHARELRRLRKGIALAWRCVQQSHPWRELGIECVRGLEVTYSGWKGWHPHLHVLLFFRAALTDAERCRVAAMLSHEWAVAVARALGAEHVPSAERGVDVSAAKNARYLAKLGLELTSPATKQKKPGHLGVWDIAKRAAEGNEGYQALWREWQQSMRGAKALTWPTSQKSELRALKDRVAKDLEARREASKRPRELVATIPRSLWAIVVSFGERVRGDILDAIRGNGDEADVYAILTDMLNARGCVDASRDGPLDTS